MKPRFLIYMFLTRRDFDLQYRCPSIRHFKKRNVKVQLFSIGRSQAQPICEMYYGFDHTFLSDMYTHNFNAIQL